MDLILVGIAIFVVVRWYKLSKFREEYLQLQIEALEKKLDVKNDEVANG